LAKGEIIGIYDADCIVEKNCLKEIVKHFSDKKIAGVSGNLKSYNRKKNMITRALSLETGFISFIEYFLNSLGANSHFFGKNMFIRKEVLEKIGYFDTDCFTEDTEMSIRMKKYKCRTILEPNAITWHEEPSSFKAFLKQRIRWVRGTIKLFKNSRRHGKYFLSDAMHGIYFYLPPFSILTVTIFALCLHFSLPLFITLPFFGLLLFNLTLLIYSRFAFKESMKDLMFLPVWFLLSNIHLVLIFKCLIDEKLNKEISWNSVRSFS
jgi:cellulose synthase/poly-beta-1,6-N-acetylglucosamine synthase-like glycosyltransferase